MAVLGRRTHLHCYFGEEAHAKIITPDRVNAGTHADAYCMRRTKLVTSVDERKQCSRNRRVGRAYGDARQAADLSSKT
jgi:hypothetical protein